METLRRHRNVWLLLLLVMIFMNGCAHRTRIAEARDDYLEVSAPPVEGGKTRAQGLLIGAAIGAVLGVLLSLALGIDVTGLAAGIGSGVGAAAGIAYAEYVIRERQKYADASAYLAARAAVLDSHIEAARNFNGILAGEMGSLRTDQEKLDAAIDDAERVAERMRVELAVQRETLEQARRDRVPDGELSQQEMRIDLLRAEESRLAAHIERLSDIKDSGPVEPGSPRGP
jgi:hypothetical protein